MSRDARCIDCNHWRGRADWCPVGQRYIRCAGAWRNCKAFEPKAEPGYPARWVRELLDKQGMIDDIERLEALPGGKVGLQVKASVADCRAFDIMWCVDWSIGVLAG